MEIKYEPVFGDQALFDGAPEDAEYAGWFCQEIRWYMILNGKILFSDGGTWCTSDNPYLSADIAAMRRIIQEPKRWTLEDKLAGRLPEVGSMIWFINDMKQVEFAGTDGGNNLWYFKRDSGAFGSAYFNCFKPIETPEEKAARLREEWCSNALDSASILSGMREYDLKRLGGYIGNIYDAMLSGDLPMPKKDDE